MSSYDQSLLGEAPKATRAQLQEGYSVDLLEQSQPPRRAPSTRIPPAQTPQPAPTPAPVNPGVVESVPEEKFTTPPSKPPFWRSRNGIIIIAVVALVIVGAVVGGAVGGTLKKSSTNTVISHPTSSVAPDTGVSTVSPTATSTSTAPASTGGQSNGGSGSGSNGSNGSGGSGSVSAGSSRSSPSAID